MALIAPGAPAKVIPLLPMKLECAFLESARTSAASDAESNMSDYYPRYVNTSLDPDSCYPDSGGERVMMNLSGTSVSSTTDSHSQASPKRGCAGRHTTEWWAPSDDAPFAEGPGQAAGWKTRRTALRSKAEVFVPEPAKLSEGEVPDPDSLNERIEREGVTSLMLHNIPRSHTRAMLVDMFDDLGLLEECNFLYLPAKLQTGMNFGYAFVNMTSPEAAQRLSVKYHLHCEAEFPSKMFCPVTISKIQGLDENVCRYQTSPIMNKAVPDQFKPAVFFGGRRVPFPFPAENGARPKKLRVKLQGVVKA